MRYVVHQYASLHDAYHALTVGCGVGVQVFAIDLDSFEKIIDIEYHTFNDLMELSLSHNLVYIGLEKVEEFTF